MAEQDKPLGEDRWLAGAGSGSSMPDGGLAVFNAPPEMSAEDKARAERLKQKQAVKRKAKRAVKEGLAALSITSLMDIFTNILLYLLTSSSTQPVAINMDANLQLPTSYSIADPVNAVPIYISKKSIIVNNQHAVDFEDPWKVPASAKKDGDQESFLIEPVRSILDEERVRQQKFINDYNDADQFKGEVTIIADRDMTSRLLFEVLFSSGQAEFGKFRFAAVRSLASVR